MRRGLTALIGTVAGTALLVGAKLGHASDGLTASGDTKATTPTATAQAASAASASAKPRATPKSGASAKPGASPSPRPGSLHDGKFTGPGVSERYGVITVNVVVSGGRITDVSASCACSGRSQSISQSAFAKLEPRVLTAQSASVQAVSGATYTYTAYKQSLGAAINAAKA
jgi:uncharacterized protein with FMN-binding domain